MDDRQLPATLDHGRVASVDGLLLLLQCLGSIPEVLREVVPVEDVDDVDARLGHGRQSEERLAGARAVARRAVVADVEDVGADRPCGKCVQRL